MIDQIGRRGSQGPLRMWGAHSWILIRSDLEFLVYDRIVFQPEAIVWTQIYDFHSIRSFQMSGAYRLPCWI